MIEVSSYYQYYEMVIITLFIAQKIQSQAQRSFAANVAILKVQKYQKKD